MDPNSKLYSGLYTGFHFDESGKLLGERVSTDPVTGSTVMAGTPLFQLALFQLADPAGMDCAYGHSTGRATADSGGPAQGVPGQGALGQICPGSLEMANVDVARETLQLNKLEQFKDVLRQPQAGLWRCRSQFASGRASRIMPAVGGR